MASEYYSGTKWRQYYSSFAVNFGVSNVGIAWSYTATAIPSMKESNPNRFSEMSPDEEAWIASIIFIGAMLACPVSGFIMQRMGLRTSMLSLTIPLVFGWGIIAFSSNAMMMIFGRFITGFCAGGVALAAPVFIAETTEPSIRGMMGFGYDLMGSFGQLFIFFVGSYVNWQWQAIVSSIVPIVFHILIVMVPESPRSLITRNKISEAKKSLAWFRSANNIELIEPEFCDILLEIERSTNEKSKLITVQDYLVPSILKPTIIGVFLMFFLQMCGAIPVLAYTVDIFKAAGTDNSYLATVLVGLTQVVMAIVAATFVDRFGRRILLITSGMLMSLTLIGLGTFMFIKESNQLDVNWIPLACLMLFIASFSIGFGPIPWIVMGELVPFSAKGLSSAVVTISSRLFGFIVVFFFNDLINIIEQHGTYWFFASICFISCIYVYMQVPETKGKSLTQIQSYFEGNILKPEVEL